MTPGPTNNAGHRQLATVGKTLEPRLPEAGHHAEVYIASGNSYWLLRPVAGTLSRGCPTTPSLVHVGQGRKWVVSTEVALTASVAGGCTASRLGVARPLLGCPLH